MKHVSPFVISEFTNSSGNIVFQLYVRLDGKRFRKNFPTREEAEAERQVQDTQLLQRETGIHAAATRLTDEQLHEAESAFAGLPDARGRSRSTSSARSRTYTRISHHSQSPGLKTVTA